MIAAPTKSPCWDLYPYAAIRGHRQTRLEEVPLGAFQLDGPTVKQLSRDNAGVFVGNCRSLERVVDMLTKLADEPYPGRWSTVLASRGMAAVVYNWLAAERGWRVRRHAPELWDLGSMTFTTPEGLRAYQQKGHNEAVAGILLVDMFCHVHRARDRFYPGYGVHDRPQRVANFRVDVSRAGWLPPFLFFTERPAKLLNTNPMLSPYCLDAWWFVDGMRLRVGRPPTSANVGMPNLGIG